MSVTEAAVSAYSEVPFYRWLYNRAGISEEDLVRDEIPVFTKQELFVYEDETHQPYYLSPRLPAPYDPELLLMTSGTTGRLLHIPVQNVERRGMHRIQVPIFESLSAVLKEQPVVWMQAEQHPTMWNLTSQNMLWSQMQYRFISQKIPAHRQCKLAQTMHCNSLIDPSSAICLDLMQAGVDPLRYGIRAIVTTYQPTQLTRYFQDLGVSVVFFYSSADSLIVHVGCSFTKPNAFHVRSRDSIHEVLLAEGEVAAFGRGRHVTTVPGSPFPLVRYSNGDTVTLHRDSCHCGFVGTSLVFEGRESHVKFGSGPNINCDEIYRYYSSIEGNGRVIMLFGRLDSGTYPHRLIVFVERAVSEPKEVEGEWETVMRVAVGGTDKGYASNVRVVAIPTGTLPKPRGSKPEILVNLESVDAGDLGQFLNDLAFMVTHERIKRNR